MKGHSTMRIAFPALFAMACAAVPAGAQNVVKYFHLDAVGNVRAVTDESGNVIERHDYLPFGEECTTGACASNPGVNAGQTRKFTGKERDPETGLDYFGARYYGSKIGRFTSVDPQLDQQAALFNPQKWNRYAYARNNPLTRIDPDGADDFIVFRPAARNTGIAWGAIRAEAPKHGHTVTIYNGAEATAARYTDALQAEDTRVDTHVTYTGHTVDYEVGNLQMAGSVLMTGNVGVGIAHPNEGTRVPVPAVSATSVGIFGCQSEDLRTQYGNADFTGIRPFTNTIAEDAGAAAYIDRLVRGGTLEQAAGAARARMVDVTSRANRNPSRHYETPQVCTNGNCQ